MPRSQNLSFPLLSGVSLLLLLAGCDSTEGLPPPLAQAESLESSGKLAEALAQYNAALEAKPDDADVLHEKARTLLKMGEPQQARMLYEQAQNLAPNDTRILNGLGVALDQLGDHLGAQAAYKKAIEIQPKDMIALNNLGRSYVVTQEYDKAIKVMEPVAMDEAASPILRKNLAEAYAMVGRDSDAEKLELKDAPADQVAGDLHAWQAKRAAALSAAFFATVGGMKTEPETKTLANKLTHRFPITMKGLVAQVEKAKEPDGYTVRVTGFTDKDALRLFCTRLEKKKIACTRYGG